MCINNGSLSKININSGSLFKIYTNNGSLLNDLKRQIQEKVSTKIVVFKPSYFSYFKSHLCLFRYVLLMFYNSKKLIQMFDLKK